MNGGKAVDGANLGLDGFQFLRRDQIGLVQHDNIGEGDLVLCLVAVFQTGGQMLGVDDSDDGVQSRFRLHALVHEERLGDRGGIGEAGGLDDDAVELVAALHQAADDADQIAAHGATDAAVVHLEHFLVGVHDQVVVHPEFAELVNHDSVFLAVVLSQDAVQQRGFAGTEVAGQHRHRYKVLGGFGHGGASDCLFRASI